MANTYNNPPKNLSDKFEKAVTEPNTQPEDKSIHASDRGAQRAKEAVDRKTKAENEAKAQQPASSSRVDSSGKQKAQEIKQKSEENKAQREQESENIRQSLLQKKEKVVNHTQKGFEAKERGEIENNEALLGKQVTGHHILHGQPRGLVAHERSGSEPQQNSNNNAKNTQSDNTENRGGLLGSVKESAEKMFSQKGTDANANKPQTSTSRTSAFPKWEANTFENIADKIRKAREKSNASKTNASQNRDTNLQSHSVSLETKGTSVSKPGKQDDPVAYNQRGMDPEVQKTKAKENKLGTTEEKPQGFFQKLFGSRGSDQVNESQKSK